jgi:hypothetical protein
LARILLREFLSEIQGTRLAKYAALREHGVL